ncbi:MAG TPA: competence/damage-inducible protein A [Saprospiraceae bacterium]|nr:competence/damage-inducible protein A [Saprospiraceae bacterium]
MKCTIITVGDEILIGQIVDTNSAWMGKELNKLGADIIEILSISDNKDAIMEALDRAFQQSELILMTGGLGPTKDDITKKSIADYFGVGMSFHQDTHKRLEAIFAKLNRSLAPSHLEQCNMPDNATILINEMGTAPGMLFTKGDCMLISMPGVPHEMKYIFSTHIAPMVFEKTNDKYIIIHKTIMTFGQGETILADMISDIVDQLPEGISIAYLPSLGFVRIRVSGKGENGIKDMVEILAYKIADRLSPYVYGYDDEKPEECVMRLFKEKALTLATAESCTGGHLGHKLTSVPGSSSYYQGGVISYSNELKMNLLRVKPSTLQQFGAVSSETVKEMAEGVIELTNADVGISISGIAGPDGGSIEKPVGTIWLGLAKKGADTYTVKINATKDRLKNIEYATNLALGRLIKLAK